MLRSVSLPESFTRGSIFLCAMPGSFEPLAEFLQELQEEDIQHVACLVSTLELQHRSPDYAALLKSGRLPAQLWTFPIPDFGLPADDSGLEPLLDGLRAKLDQGEAIVIHCAFGQGRTGLIATLLLVRMGLPLDEAVRRIREAGSCPDTARQRQYLAAKVAHWRRPRA